MSGAPRALAASSALNSAIADKALSYVGQWGSAACADATFSGYTGGPPLGNGDNMDGECRSFVNCILKMVAGINTAYGADDYQRAFREQGGQPISRTGGMRGDIIQVGNGVHTSIITENLGNGTYEVVDSNFVSHHKVGVHSYTVPSNGQIWRMGTVHVWIKSLAANRYVSSEQGYGGANYAMLRARGTSVGTWESFTLIGDCSRQCALRSDANGLFVSAELGYQGYAWAEVRARAAAAQGWEQWRFVGNCETSCAVLSLANGRYVSTELAYTGAGQNMLRARATQIRGWERFQIKSLARDPSSTTPPPSPGPSGGGSVAGSGGNGSGTYPETTGGVTRAWTDYSSAGGSAGPSIPANQTVEVTCKVAGFQVSDGNTWWYQLASSPWNNTYYASADAFYNNGQTSGNLQGTPFVDPNVPDCGSSAPPPPLPETTGGVTHTWTNYTNAGGTEGPSIGAYQTVQITCKVTGFVVSDGNSWWYRIASDPWNNSYYASADAFYNNGQTSGSLQGTPFFDPNVPNC